VPLQEVAEIPLTHEHAAANTHDGERAGGNERIDCPEAYSKRSGNFRLCVKSFHLTHASARLLFLTGGLKKNTKWQISYCGVVVLSVRFFDFARLGMCLTMYFGNGVFW
jgi:hypothetical protein